MQTEPLSNWSGTVTFGAARVLRPETVEELREIVARSTKLRALGSAHSFNTLADTDGDLVLVAALPQDIVVDAEAATAWVSAGVRYGELALPVYEAGLALHNMGSLPHISVAGATATGTHGSGDANGNLATAVSAIELIRPDGELVLLTREDHEFAGAVVSLGALGIVTRMRLDLVADFSVEQTVYDGLPRAELINDFEAIFSSAYSVSVFTGWDDKPDQVWVKALAGTTTSPAFAAQAADGPRHPIPGLATEPCTQQLGVPGPWHERLPHFRLAFTPSSGEEIQTEYLVPRDTAVEALRALEAIRGAIAPVLQIAEVRTIAADDLWLSTAHRQDSVGLHFTWVKDAAAIAPVVLAVEEALAPFGARPHWGKVFSMAPAVVASRYQRYDDFRHLMAAYDPDGKFRNGMLDRYFPPS